MSILSAGSYLVASLLASEPLPLWQGMLLMLVVLIVTLVLVGFGFYYLIRVLAGVIDRKRETWAGVADDLGLQMNDSGGHILKEMSGKRGDRNVSVTYFTVPTGENSTDEYAAVDVQFLTPLNFSFKVNKLEMFYQKVVSFFDNYEQTIGHEAFDKVFKVESSDLPSLLELLNVEIPDAESSSLLNDLMLAHKKYHRVIVTDTSICLGVRADLGDSHRIEPALKKSVYLAERVETATRKVQGTEGNG